MDWDGGWMERMEKTDGKSGVEAVALGAGRCAVCGWQSRGVETWKGNGSGRVGAVIRRLTEGIAVEHWSGWRRAGGSGWRGLEVESGKLLSES